jgi:hypothetical protein
MRKIIVIVVIISVSIFLGQAVVSLCSLQNPNLITREIDVVYDSTDFITNTLLAEERIITYDDGRARINLFTGLVGSHTVNMCTVEMSKVMDSQVISLQLIVNGRQEFFVPMKLSSQVYNNPKVIEGKIVVRAYTGMYNPEKAHFYVVIDPDGSGYTTEVEVTQSK